MAAAVMRGAGVDPIEPYPGTSKPWRSVCLRCNREVTPQFRHVRSGMSSGCIYCGGRAAIAP
ncbi:MAG: hypothetical protein JWL58_7277 [Streptosporangiaceae bacterium]|jgi:hypothetical protein|nr:hypothetical protein [Streptosporangiaceae bacterium]